MTFFVDWTSPHADTWLQHLGHLAGKPNLRALEIGVLEGRSTCWFLDNILTDIDCTIDCIDPFLQTHTDGNFLMSRTYAALTNEAYKRFVENTAKHTAKISIHQRYSLNWFAQLPKPLPVDVYDFAYIDGSHTLWDCATDLFLTWRMMKLGGIIIVDDYVYKDVIDLGGGDVIIPGVTEACDAWLMATKCEVLHKGTQLIARKA